MALGANVTMLAQRRVADFWRRLSLRLRVADFAGNVALGDELVSASGIVQPVGVFDFIGVPAGGYVKFAGICVDHIIGAGGNGLGNFGIFPGSIVTFREGS